MIHPVITWFDDDDVARAASYVPDYSDLSTLLSAHPPLSIVAALCCNLACLRIRMRACVRPAVAALLCWEASGCA